MNMILLIVQIVIAVLLVGVILVQRSGSDGLGGLNGGSNNNFISGKASANLLTRATAILATLFMLNSLALAKLATISDKKSSILDQALSIKDSPAKKEATESGAPVAE
jgi:preprotein translocase subunit SecG